MSARHALKYLRQAEVRSLFDRIAALASCAEDALIGASYFEVIGKSDLAAECRVRGRCYSQEAFTLSRVLADLRSRAP